MTLHEGNCHDVFALMTNLRVKEIVVTSWMTFIDIFCSIWLTTTRVQEPKPRIKSIHLKTAHACLFPSRTLARW